MCVNTGIIINLRVCDFRMMVEKWTGYVNFVTFKKTWYLKEDNYILFVAFNQLFIIIIFIPTNW